MPTTQQSLDDGVPSIPEGTAPTDLPTEEQREWGAAFMALLGKRGTAPSELATAILRAPVLITGVAVASNEANLPTSGAVIAVAATSAAVPGGKLPIPDGGAASGEVLIIYDGEHRPTLIFDPGDAVTEISVTQLQIPDVFIEVLQSLVVP